MPSTSTKAGGKKPKRPLSGYNLFYRYKRIKVLEAAARPANGNGRSNDALIREVITALPGLEGVSPRSLLFTWPPARIDEYRAAAIRRAMEGKLLPNENGRSRVHRKVHGVGFVEMGKMMRQTWGEADKFTKGVFFELAEAGRGRWKKEAAEYKIERKKAKSEAIELAKTLLGISPWKKSTQQTPDPRKSGTVGLAAKPVVTPPPAPEIDPMLAEVLAKAAWTHLITNKSQDSEVAPAKYQAAANATVPIEIEEEAKPASDPMLEDGSAWATNTPPPAVTAKSAVHGPEGYRRPMSTEIDFDSAAMAASAATANPPAASLTADGTKAAQPSYRRIVSTEELFEPLAIGIAARPDVNDASTEDLFEPLAVGIAARPDAKDAFEFQTTGTHDARSLRNDQFDSPVVEEPKGPAAAETKTVDGREMRGKTLRTLPAGARTVLPPADEGGASAATGRDPRRGAPVRAPPVRADGGAGVPAPAAGNVAQEERASQQILGLLQTAIQRLKDEISQKNAELPPEMRVSLQDNMTSSSRDFLAASDGGGARVDSGRDAVIKEGEYAQDFVEMISKLGEAIDESP